MSQRTMMIRAASATQRGASRHSRLPPALSELVAPRVRTIALVVMVASPLASAQMLTWPQVPRFVAAGFVVNTVVAGIMFFALRTRWGELHAPRLGELYLLVFEAEHAIDMVIMHAKDPPTPPSTRTELDVPAALEATLMRCLEKSPDDRYPDATALDAALAAVEVPPWTEDQAGAWWKQHHPVLSSPPKAE